MGIGGAIVASDGATSSFVNAGTIPDNAQIDLLFVNNPIRTLVFSGLDSAFSYNLEIMSKIDAGRNANDIDVNGTVISVEPDVAPFVIAFNDILVDENNEIVLSFPNAGGGVNLQHINAMELTVAGAAPPVEDNVQVVSSGFNANNGFDVTFSGLDTSIAYELRYSPDLETPFTLVPGTSQIPSSTEATYTDPSPTLPGQGFYQLFISQ